MVQPSLCVSNYTIVTSRGHFVLMSFGLMIVSSAGNSGMSALWKATPTVNTVTVSISCPQLNGSNVVIHRSRKLVGKDFIHNCINPCVVAHCVHVFVCFFIY